MTRLWGSGAQTVAQIVDALNSGSERSLAYTTVMTILVRLRDKGYVDRTSSGRQYVYRAAMDEPSLAALIGRRELSRLIQRFGAPSLARFAADLTETDAELTMRLRALAEQNPE
jgi:predicted transcriptional regulator